MSRAVFLKWKGFCTHRRWPHDRSLSKARSLPERIATGHAQPVTLTEAQYDRYLKAAPIPFTTAAGGTTTSGPASFHRFNFWSRDGKRPPAVLVEVHLPRPANPDFLTSSAGLFIDHVWNTKHEDVYDRHSPFEQNTFPRIAFLEQPGAPAYLKAIRVVFLFPSATLDTLATIEGRLVLRLPKDAQELTFDVLNPVADQSSGPVTVSWVGLSGSRAFVWIQGPLENYLGMVAYNAHGQRLERGGYSLPDSNPTIDAQKVMTEFYGTPAKVGVIIAGQMLERSYPFRLKK